MISNRILRSCLLFLTTVAACSSGPAKNSGGDPDGGPSRGSTDATLEARDAAGADDTMTAAETGPLPIEVGTDAAADIVATVDTSPAPDAPLAPDAINEMDAGPGGQCKNEPMYDGPLLIFAGGPNFGNGGAVGQCGFPNDKLPAGHFFGAVDSALYGNSDACGACVRIESMDGKVTADIQIIDRVDPVVHVGGHVLSADPVIHGMFGQGDNPQVKFHFVPCDVSGNIQVQFDATTTTGSSLLVMNYRTELMKLQVATAGGWRMLDRTPFNRWPIPFAIDKMKNSLRFIDGSGRSIDAPDLPFVPGLQDSGAQFPICAEGGKPR